ncbi:Crp/Fnr family transcriptional regulator [Puteibacter caeruleilacunae]|nr:Crp/Fnr family transcriptional regulator [Puteibacter caeruleilacunae]
MERIHPEILKKRFPYLEDQLIIQISEVGNLKEFTPGEQVIAPGQYIKTFPLVLDGRIRIFRISPDNEEILLYYLNSGEVCSMSLNCCLSDKRSNIKAIIEEEATLLFIPVEYISSWMTEFPTWKEFVMYSYQKRFNELLDTIDGIAFHNLDERLIRFFTLRFENTSSSIFIGTHQEIANALNSSREVISRLLKKLEADGKIKLSRNKVDFTGLM